MIRPFLYALILILSADAATADAQDSISAATSPTPNPSNTEKITFTEVNVDGPYIAMTFDDGPHATNTPQLLEMAAQRHIKLTFFVLGECVAQNPDVLRQEVAAGHEIGNHSWSHPNLAKLSDANVRSQLQRTEDIIEKTAGIKPKLMRPPYGELTKRQRILVNHEFGYKVILWDVDPLDWKRPGSNIVAQRIIAGARPGSIILSHDIHPPTIAAMPQVFDALLAKGFKFVTVSELLAMDKGGERPEVVKTPHQAQLKEQATQIQRQRVPLRSSFYPWMLALPVRMQWQRPPGFPVQTGIEVSSNKVGTRPSVDFIARCAP